MIRFWKIKNGLPNFDNPFACESTGIKLELLTERFGNDFNSE